MMRLRWSALSAVAIALAAPAPGSTLRPRPRPRGGTNSCLSHRNSQWVNDNPADLQALLNYGVGGQAASTINGGSESLTFVDHQMNAVVAIDSMLGQSTGHVDVIATA